MCPAANGYSCIDSDDVVYGVLCNTRFSGEVITNSGKRMLMDKSKRDYSGTFDNCVGFCDTYSKGQCLGVNYQGGYCMSYASITGTFNAVGEIAAIRQ